MLLNISKRLIPDVKVALKWCRPSSTMSSPNKEHKGQMMALQNSLLRLPVPPLHPSLERYLLSVRPLLSEEEYHQTEKIVRGFGSPGGVGEKLHAMLMERSKHHENWLSDWWLNVAYLEFRMPVIVYSSPGLVFPVQEFKTEDEHLKYTARLIAGALSFKISVDKHLLSPDMLGDKPLDMAQYMKIFSTCRIPDSPRDRLLHFNEAPDPPKHIVVVHNNHYFQVNVFGNDGEPLNESQIFSQLKTLVDQSRHAKSPIGVLTTEKRDIWAKAYKRLCKSNKINKESIKIIQSSIFLVCLDKAVPVSGSINRQTHTALQTVHGGGSKGNAGNRWYDKTIQFIIGEDGTVGLTYEHSPSEGPPVATLMDHVLQYIEETKGNRWLPSAKVTPPTKLQFVLSEENEADIQEAERDLDILVDDLEMTCFTYGAFGRNFVKSQRLSPDSFLQMAMQLAFFRIHNQIGATYESASTRMFLHGRTETIRSASVEALDFCKHMMDSSAPVHVKAAALRTAVDSHKDYTNKAIHGLGVDRLLLGLKLLAVESGMNIPELYMDPGYTTSTHFRLSTSQVPSRSNSVMCYGPLVPDGYGCCYNPRPNSVNFGLSACNSSPETHSINFMKALTDSLTEMHDTLLSVQQSKL